MRVEEGYRGQVKRKQYLIPDAKRNARGEAGGGVVARSGLEEGSCQGQSPPPEVGRVKKRGEKGTRVSCVILSQMTSGRISMVVGRVWVGVLGFCVSLQTLIWFVERKRFGKRSCGNLQCGRGKKKKMCKKPHTDNQQGALMIPEVPDI